MTGFCYAMISDDGRAKIGWSTDPARRLAKINSDTAIPVKLGGVIPATKEQEAELLWLLRPWKIHRSWHRIDGPVALFINFLTPPPVLPGLRGMLRRHGYTLVALANKMGVDKATITRWCQRRVPAERVLDVEQITGIPRYELRPDIYPRGNIV